MNWRKLFGRRVTAEWAVANWITIVPNMASRAGFSATETAQVTSMSQEENRGGIILKQ